jgi:hypothetical protein
MMEKPNEGSYTKDSSERVYTHIQAQLMGERKLCYTMTQSDRNMKR